MTDLCTPAAVAAVCATPLHAERVTAHHDAPPGAAWFARRVIDNQNGVYHATETLDTAHGPVSVRYSTTIANKRNDPASADSACVVALPDGVVAVPECLDVMEQETGQIFLMQWNGG